MKTELFAILLTTAAAFQASASEFYTSATNNWFQGQQSTALSLANARLSVRTNDVAALLVKASYDYDFSDAAAVSNTLTQVLSVSRSVDTARFRKCRPFLEALCSHTIQFVATEDPVQQAADRAKVSGPGHHMRFYFALNALERDGQIED